MMSEIRSIRESDSLEDLTTMLHRAYAAHAVAGLHFLATHQSVEKTRERVHSGHTFVMLDEQKLIGTVTVKLRDQSQYGEYQPTVPLASFSQLAIDPDYRGQGLGVKLIEYVEQFARSNGCAEMALDTSQLALGLIQFYEKLGYEIQARADWRPVVNYESWILVKEL
jgi:GNAT superfamily N-acetyltransferase